MRRVRRDDRELELRLGASISVYRLSSQEIRMTAIPNALGIPTRSPAAFLELWRGHSARMMSTPIHARRALPERRRWGTLPEVDTRAIPGSTSLGAPAL
jgi:Mg-chelatase subunit ChlI